MTDSRAALSKGLPLKVVISLGIVTCCLRLGTTNLKWRGEAVKLRADLVGWDWYGGVLKAVGLQLRLRGEANRILARSTRDTHCIQLEILSLQRERDS